GVINSYFAADGQVNIKTAQEKILVTGYDFLYDSALDIKNRFISSSKTTEWLLDDPEAGGDEYTPADLENELFNETPIHQLANINTHANHYNFGTPSGNLSTSTMDTNPKKLSRTILYTSGCHSGLPVPPVDTNNLDLPELMSKKEVLAYIGNTGYGWGIRYGKGLTEKLMEKITEKILSKDSIKIGEALGEAKRSYYLEEKRYDVFDEKVLHELTLYGIPNTIIVNSVAGAIEGKDEELPPPDYKEDKVCVKGICMEKKLWKEGEKEALPPGVTQLDLNFIFGPETYQKITTPDGDYYTLNGRASGETGDAIQPHFVYNSYLSGTKAHGIIFAGGSYSEESPFDPVIAVPRSTNTDNGEGPLPGQVTFVPGVRVSFGVSAPSTLRAIGQVGYTNMLVHTGYYSNNVESRFQDMQFTIYYSNSEDYTPPTITDPGAGGFHTLQGLEATFNATITDASGVYRAVIIYNDKRTGRWKSFDLQKGSGNNWSGKITLKGNITYYLQAIDNAGNVGIISITGQDLDGNNQPYGSTWSGPKVWDITLTDTDSDELPDAYEEQYYCLNKNLNDSAQDSDYDYLTNLQEFLSDTNPCKGDTDGGGDNDGSEKNNGRDNLNKGDDKHLTIMVTKNGGSYTIDWNDSYGENSLIDGYYFVYRSDTPFFDPQDRINPSPIPNGTTSYVDSNPPCTVCYYNVWNYQLDTQPPQVDAVVPATGPVSGGTSVKVYGNNFQNGAKVYFDNVLATNIVFVNESQINCKTPPHSAGAVDVKVVNPNGQDGVLTGGFTYQ
ncbi:MAG: IPT/TIG domain-containing protein, partial [candidate division WOR-3 bacterium]